MGTSTAMSRITASFVFLCLLYPAASSVARAGSSKVTTTAPCTTPRKGRFLGRPEIGL